MSSISNNFQQLIQFGYYQFSNISAVRTDTSNIKTNLSDTNYTDGKIKNNGLNRDYKDDIEYNVQFTYEDDIDDIHSLMKMQYAEPQIVFFAEKYNKKPPFGRLKDGKYDYRILFNYAHVISPIRRSTDSRLGDEANAYEFTIRLMTPYKYECEFGKLQYIDKSKLSQFKGQVWGAFSQPWGGVGVWDQDILATAPIFGNEIPVKKQQLLEFNQECRPSILFLYDDIYFANLAGNISTGNQKNNRYWTTDLSSAQAVDTDFLYQTNEPLSNGSELFSGVGLDLITSAPSFVNQIEIQSFTGATPLGNALRLNESVSIYNQKTKSGFKITWLDSNSPNKLLVRSHIQDGVFDQDGNFLNPYGNYKGKYKIEFLSQSQSNYLLEFRSLYPYSQDLNLEQGDQLTIQHNQSLTATNLIRITIKNLKTWH
jgi:hypothetical protein